MIRSPIYQRRGLFRSRSIKFSSVEQPNRTAKAQEHSASGQICCEFSKEHKQNVEVKGTK